MHDLERLGRGHLNLIGIGNICPDKIREVLPVRSPPATGDASVLSQLWRGSVTVLAPGSPFQRIRPYRMHVAAVPWLQVQAKRGKLTWQSEWCQSSTYMVWERLAFAGERVLVVSDGGRFAVRLVKYWEQCGVELLHLVLLEEDA